MSVHSSEHSAKPLATPVDVRCTGHVRTAIGEHRFPCTFEGETLADVLGAFFEEYDVEELLIAEAKAESTARGWARAPAELPGTW